jgi:hypothetical protein
MTLNGIARRRSTAVATGALVIALAACGSQPNTVTVKKAVSPQKVVLASVQATTAAKSARISMSVSADTTGAGDFALTANGVSDFTTGDGSLTMQVSGPVAKFIKGSMEIRTVDGVGYIKMPEVLGAAPGGDKWLKTPDLSANGIVPGAGQSDPTQFLAYLETVSSNVTKVGSETIRGVETTHYHASLDLGKAVDKAKVPASLRDDLRKLLQTKSGSAIPADVWVDADGLARRIQMTIDVGTTFSIADVPTGPAPKITVSMDLYDFGVPVHVEAPPPGDVQDFPNFGPSGSSGTLGAPA